jgi:DNA-binding NtrC family response regulator
MAVSPRRIIVVEKGEELTPRLRRLLDPKGVEIQRAPSVDHVLEQFEVEFYDVLLTTSSAFHSGRMDGIELLEIIAAKSPRTQILFLVQPDRIRQAIAALRAGTYQYAKLPVSDEELRLLIESAFENQPSYGQNLLLRRRRKRLVFEKMTGRDSSMQEVFRQVRQAATTDMPVLVVGETGTGKDLVARAIHEQSRRKDGPYIPVNLGALPSELVASELFGHEKGAFTGAVSDRKGHFERAHQGTVFLDEIGTIDEKVQVSLLRVIERKKFHRLGGRQTLKTNARIIAATNADLAEAVAAGTFREDLYYRLDVFRITLPKLSERPGDVPLLVHEFVKRFSRSFNKSVKGVSPECIQVLESYKWPGNVRELKNVVQRAVLVCNGEMVLPDHLPPRFRPGRRRQQKVSFEIGASLNDVEKQMILRTLAATKNNRKRAAELLGISRSALYSRLKKHGIGTRQGQKP